MARNKHAATIKKAEARILAAEKAAYEARFDAVDRILCGASRDDVLDILSWALSNVLAGYCPEHRGEIQAEFLDLVDDALKFRDQDDEVEITAEDVGASVH